MIVNSLEKSFTHGQNGMTLADMKAAMRVADRLGEVIIFRSTGPWSRRWLEDGFPSKNFHVKGKSSDWGPHAGLVPYDGVWSKVGFDDGKAKKGTAANEDGLHSNFASRKVLRLTLAQLMRQLTQPEGNPPRAACVASYAVPRSSDMLVTARRSGDNKLVCFRAFYQVAGGDYIIRVYTGIGDDLASPANVLKRDPSGAASVDLLVMASNEVGAGRPMTGDYDLMAVCPTWAQYGSLTSREITKSGIRLEGEREERSGLSFSAGVGMDNVMDTRLSTMGRSDGGKANDYLARKEQHLAKMRNFTMGRMSSSVSEVYFGGGAWAEHQDMGNLTPRILRCINELNREMGAVGDHAAMRRVHHNAESHRSRIFGALTEKDMLTKKDGEEFGDGYPLTVFQPGNVPTGDYDTVCTIESLEEFRGYARHLKDCGFYVPKNWIWAM